MRQRKKLKLLSFLIAICSAFTSAPSAATIKVSSVSQADVQAAVASAHAGDTMLIPAGTATWTQAVAITKPLSIIGSGNTTITAAGLMPNGFYYLKSFSSDLPVRISNHIFIQTKALTYTYAIYMDPSIKLSNMRIDHNVFKFGYFQLWWAGAMGVVDHNVFQNSWHAVEFSAGNLTAQYKSWESMDAGTANALFMEDNVFLFDPDYPYADIDFCFDTHNGGKLVFRRNELDEDNTAMDASVWFCPFQNHGNNGDYWQKKTGQESRGQSVMEVYENNVHGKRVAFLLTLRGSANFVYNNRVRSNTSGLPRLANIYEEEPYHSTVFIPSRTSWPAEDQIHNTFLWGNTLNGNLQQNSDLSIGAESTPYIQLNRDYFLHAPQSTGGKEYFTGANGASGSYPTDGTKYPTLGTMAFTPDGPNAYFPYVPYVYPHPLTLADYPGTRALGLSAGATASQVTLQWNTVTGASRYTILRNWQEIATVTSAGYSETRPALDAAYLVTAYDTTGAVLSAEGVMVVTGSAIAAFAASSAAPHAAIRLTRSGVAVTLSRSLQEIELAIFDLSGQKVFRAALGPAIRTTDAGGDGAVYECLLHPALGAGTYIAVLKGTSRNVKAELARVTFVDARVAFDRRTGL